MSLIPPEILNSRNIGDVLQDSFDEDTINEIVLCSDLNASHDEAMETANPQILLAGQDDDSVQPENIVDGQDHVNRVHPENIVDR